MKEKNVSLENKVILVTGAAGFIGSNLVMELLREVHPVHIVGIDNMNEYYDVSIKEYRLNQIEELVGKQEGSTWKFIKGSIADKALIDRIFTEDKPAVVVNLAAQAGVRYSITNPDVYIESNLIGFYNILEACRHSYDDGARSGAFGLCFILLCIWKQQKGAICDRRQSRQPGFFICSYKEIQ